MNGYDWNNKEKLTANVHSHFFAGKNPVIHTRMPKNDGGNGLVDSGEVIDQINDLKAENAELRKKLLVLSASPALQSSQNGTTSCRLCSILESKIDRLSSEIEYLRSRSNPTNPSGANDVSDTISRERKRRARMEVIIDRQRSHIRFLYSRLDSMTHRDGFSGNEAELDLPASDQSSAYRFSRESDSPPWEIDMDDLARQLQDLDNNVQRVEASSNRLSTSTRAAFLAANPGRNYRVESAKVNLDRSKRSVLDKVFKTSSE